MTVIKPLAKEANHNHQRNINVKTGLTEEQVYNIIWEKVKSVNKKLTSYKAIKNLEIKHEEFEKTTTMKIKRYAELKKDKN